MTEHELIMGMVDISDLDKAHVLKWLYDNAKVDKVDKMDNKNMVQLTNEQAKQIIQKDEYINYIYNKQISVYLGNDQFFPGWYDLAHGHPSIYDPHKKRFKIYGTCHNLIKQLRQSL